MSEQSRLLLLPGVLKVWRKGGATTPIRVLIVDRRFHGGYGSATCTVVLREPMPEDVTWTGSRLPGGIAEAEAEDVTVDLQAVEAGLVP